MTDIGSIESVGNPLAFGPGWRLTLGDSLELMAQMEDESVDAIVTSPPYADQRHYGDRARLTARRTQSRKQRREEPMRAVEWLLPYLAQMRRVVREHGSLLLNLGIVMRDGEETEWADEVLRRARHEQGWKLLHRLVWHKPNGIPPSHPVYAHIMHEWVFWLSPSIDAYRGYDADTRREHAEGTVRRIGQPYMSRKDERYERRGTVHDLHPEGARPGTVFSAGVGGQRVDHPAVMAPELARWLVCLGAPPGATVLDPFAGSATTGLAALEKGRQFIGMELEARYFREATARLLMGPAAAFSRRREEEIPGQLGLEGLHELVGTDLSQPQALVIDEITP